MKDTGKTINGIKLYSDPECLPNMLYFMPKPEIMPRPVNAKEKQKYKEFGEALAKHYDLIRPLRPLQQRRTGKLTSVPQMPKDFIGWIDEDGNVIKEMA